MELTEAERRRIREAQLRFAAPPSSCEVWDVAVERDVDGVDGEEAQWPSDGGGGNSSQG